MRPTTDVSSANLMMWLELNLAVQSWVSSVKSSGLSTQPCGAPVLSVVVLEVLWPTRTDWGLPVKKSRIQLQREFSTPKSTPVLDPALVWEPTEPAPGPAPPWHPCVPIAPGPLPLHGPGPPLDIFLFSVCGASGIRSLKGGLCHGPAGVPRLATRCLWVLSTWLVVCWCHVLPCRLSVPSHLVT